MPRFPLLPLALLAAVIATGVSAEERPAPAARRTPGDAIVQALGEERLARLVATRPDVVSRMGWAETAGRLEPVTESSLADDRAWLVQFRARLDAVPASSLSRDGAVDRDALAACALRDSFALAADGPWRRDPGTIVDLVADAVLAPVLRLDASVCTRLGRCRRTIARVPEALRAATVQLRRPERVATERAIERLGAVLGMWRTMLPGYFASCRDPETQAELVAGDTAAVRAGERFLAWLREDQLPAAPDDARLGADGLARWLAAETGRAQDLAALERAAASRLAAVNARLEGLAGPLGSGGSAAARRAALATQGPPAPVLLDSLRAALDFAGATLSAAPGFEDARGYAERVRIAVAPGGLAAPIHFEPTLPFASGAIVGRLYVATGDSAAGAALSPAAARVLAAEWVGGRMPIALARARATSLRRALAFPAVAEARVAAARRALGDASPAVSFAAGDREREGLGGALAALAVHARHATQNDAADSLRAHGFSPAEAARLVRETIVEPTPLAVLAAALDDERLVADAVALGYPAPDLRAWGELPAPVIREWVLAESARRAALARGARSRVP